MSELQPQESGAVETALRAALSARADTVTPASLGVAKIELLRQALNSQPPPSSTTGSGGTVSTFVAGAGIVGLAAGVAAGMVYLGGQGGTGSSAPEPGPAAHSGLDPSAGTSPSGASSATADATTVTPWGTGLAYPEPPLKRESPAPTSADASEGAEAPEEVGVIVLPSGTGTPPRVVALPKRPGAIAPPQGMPGVALPQMQTRMLPQPSIVVVPDPASPTSSTSSTSSTSIVIALPSLPSQRPGEPVPTTATQPPASSTATPPTSTSTATPPTSTTPTSPTTSDTPTSTTTLPVPTMTPTLPVPTSTTTPPVSTTTTAPSTSTLPVPTTTTAPSTSTPPAPTTTTAPSTSTPPSPPTSEPGGYLCIDPRFADAARWPGWSMHVFKGFVFPWGTNQGWCIKR